MAGSYNHLKGEGAGWHLIGNMGDAYECVEELLYLVEYALGEKEAKKILKERFYPMANGEKKPDFAFIETQTVMQFEPDEEDE